MLFLARFSKVHCSKGLLSIGKSVLGLVQLSGLSLVASPPMRIRAFKEVFTVPRLQVYIHYLTIKRFRGRAENYESFAS